MGVPWDFAEVEARWQARWEADGLYRFDAEATPAESKHYNLAEFPYPSAEGLHLGHVFKYGGLDVYGRRQRMLGRAVFQPMGFDAFGVNAEAYALRIGEHPRTVLDRNIPRFRRQLSSVGIGWDWSRQVDTSRPEYFRWTQWIFTRLLRAGLAHRAEAPVSWCPECATVLANELVEEGCCERCGTEVVERVLVQWFLRTTAYADRLVAGLDDLDWPESAKRKQRRWILEADGSLRLRDWLVSRQRYWGTPVPVLHCAACGPVPVPDEDLPVTLPEGVDPRPTGDGRPPLARADESWRRAPCPACGGPAERDTDVLDNFVESAWYFLRYPSTDLEDRPWDPERTARLLPVDMYAGGPEHVTRHHLFARFVTMALHDLGLVPFAEPFPRIRYGGFLQLDGSKMSKSRGNVVDPEEYVEAHGGDVLRMHLLFSARWDQDGSFSPEGVAGVERFLARVWRLVLDGGGADAPEAATDQPAVDRAVEAVGEAIDRMAFNVGIARLMELVSALEAGCSGAARRTLVLLLAPFAPYVAEELWSRLGEPYSVHRQPWPTPSAAGGPTDVEVVVQVDGRRRAAVRVGRGAGADEVLAAAAAAGVSLPEAPARVVHVPDRVVNLVTA